MVRILSRSFALVFATVLVGGGDGASRATTIVTAPSPSSIPMTAGWQKRDCGAFRILLPDETVLRQNGRFGGTLVDRRFTLTYAAGVSIDAGIAKSGQDYRESAVEVGGRSGVLRSSEFPGQAEPYFLQLYVPRAIEAKGGRWLALEIHGWMTTPDRRWLAERVVRSVDFTPSYDVPVQPVRPRVAPPVIEIEMP